MSEAVVWTAPCDRCGSDASWRNDPPGQDPITLHALPLAELVITCPTCDTTIAVHTVPPPPSAPRCVHELRAIAERTAS